MGYLVRAHNLGKEYLLMPGGRPYQPTLAEGLANVFHPGKLRRQAREFWALKDVSFDIKAGERVAIIGHNGSGKSTLLKILSRVIYPTTGEAELRGRVASVLEVGTGFHPELTGRENIYLNGAIRGMRVREIRQRFDEITAFAGIEQFIDMPVKFYSSGMYVRLAFSISAHLPADIVLLDEVLAVGDAEFQKKSFEKIKAIAEAGAAVMFVSHNLNMISKLCGRVMWLKDGSLAGDADNVTAMLAAYTSAAGWYVAGFADSS